MKINLDKSKIKTIKLEDSTYPEKLKEIYNPPKTIYLIGNEKLLNQKSIAIIGCRECTRYGAENAYKFGYELAKENICVISGFAKGIDTYSHKGAVSAKGKTIAVLGCGLDIIYPPENIELYKQILLQGGAIISEYPLGSKPEKHHFPERNRIISGLSDGVLVVEAKKKSGTMPLGQKGHSAAGPEGNQPARGRHVEGVNAKYAFSRRANRCALVHF